jgi:CRP/FNR family transcriptional regulator, cyclic AMP receptor protein
MQLDEKKQVLAKNFLFRQLKAKDLGRVAKLALERHYDHGQIIFQKGQPERKKDIGMMAVIAGRIKISTCSPDDKEIILKQIKPGGFFGEIALIDGKGHSADATAIGECRLLFIARSDFIPLLRRDPELTLQLLMILCQKLRNTSDMVETVRLLPIPVRLARFLLKMAEDGGLETPAGLQVNLKLSQREIRDLIGATRESVNKQLRAWQEQGMIKMEIGPTTLITFLEEEAVEDLAGGSVMSRVNALGSL